MNNAITAQDLLDITAHITSHYVTHNKLSAAELCDVIENVYMTFCDISTNPVSYRDMTNIAA